MTAVTETPVTEMPGPFVFTDAAAEKVKQLIDEEGNPDLKLRVFVQGGGCSGFQYGFTFDETINEDDTVMNKAGVQLLIDSMSAFGALPVDARSVTFDALAASSNKCIEGVPGLGFVLSRISALEKTISQKTVTYDFARMMPAAHEVKCSEFGEAVVKHMG